MGFKQINRVTTIVPQATRIANVLPGVDSTDAVNKAQLDEAISSTLEGNNNDFTGNNTFSGTNTHSGVETFSNALGVKTDAITEVTAGNGTTIKTHVLAVTGATLTSATTPAISAATSGTTYTLSKVDGITVTLPACSATNIGLKYKFVTSVGYIINTAGSDVFVGGGWGSIANPADAVDMEFSASTANKTMTLSATTTGGLIGGWVELVCVSATQWHVSYVTLGTGTIATPFSN